MSGKIDPLFANHPDILAQQKQTQDFIEGLKRDLAPDAGAGKATFEHCAKIADQVATNAHRRAAGYPEQSPAQEAAYNKMEGAQDVAHAIRAALPRQAQEQAEDKPIAWRYELAH